MKPPSGWEDIPVIRNGKKVGLFLVKDNEIHCLRDNACAGKWLTRQDLERLTKPIFEKYGFLVTKVRLGNEQGNLFVQRLGFYETGKDEINRHYRAERLKHARK